MQVRSGITGQWEHIMPGSIVDSVNQCTNPPTSLTRLEFRALGPTLLLASLSIRIK